MNDILPDEYVHYWHGDDSAIVTLRAEEYEGIVATILHHVGSLPSLTLAPPGIQLFHKYKNDEALYQIYMGVSALFNDWLKHAVEEAKATEDRMLNPVPFAESAYAQYGTEGRTIAIEYIELLMQFQHRSPWAPFRRIEWKDIVELDGLFRSESLETQHGTYLDQRYIDYIAQNFDNISVMNWRKFEGLTCEFFERAGYYVEIGEGRADGGIDARVWLKEEQRGIPPAILVQCKREKGKIQQGVVKALWADMQDEKATSGLIVTTSALAPSAEQVRTARGYKIGAADRKVLRKWIEAMRTPGTGVFMGR